MFHVSTVFLLVCSFAPQPTAASRKHQILYSTNRIFKDNGVHSIMAQMTVRVCMIVCRMPTAVLLLQLPLCCRFQADTWHRAIAKVRNVNALVFAVCHVDQPGERDCCDGHERS